MQSISRRSRFSDLTLRGALAVVCAALLVPGNATLIAQEKPSAAGTAPEAAAKLPPEQLDSLVAPIALYPDPLLAQTLAASTYPLEIIQLQQWMAKNPNLKDKALADAVAKQPWDPAVQSMAAFPEAVKRLADDVQWTTDLGNAFLAQQSDVMDAVQRMRKKAQDTGALKTTEQQKVETQVVEQKTVIIVEPADPQVIYVPSYSPTIVYGPPVYPYPPIYYPPPPPPGAAFVSFTMGVMIGAAFWGGACCACGWHGGGNNIYINNSNNFNQINHNTNVGRGQGGGNNWQHNSQHRGGAPYTDKATASKYGGTAKGSSPATRQASAGQQQAKGGASAGQQQAKGGASAGQQQAKGGASAGNRSTGSSAGNRGASPSAKGGGFGGGSGGFSGSSARASSSRGASSMGGRSGGGGRRR
jgi:hypothetical protein